MLLYLYFLINFPTLDSIYIIKRAILKKYISKLINDIIIDLNAEIDSLRENFDYKSKLREAPWVKNISKEIVTNYIKLVSRDRMSSFQNDWESNQ